ncbi:MAG: hypothetical protein J4N98_02810 [Chloroflexi bacterium]|nr:hypothetical protein [Chloroflexota bacterium]
MAAIATLGPANASGNIITEPDASTFTGRYSSLALDANGYPVISYQAENTKDLRILLCDDPNCEGAGESITSPDTQGPVGAWSSLVLDASGNPVVSYLDEGRGELKLLHCDDPNCDGGGESITSPDTGPGVAGQTSLVLDASGNPVVSYLDINDGAVGSSELKVLHCDDPNCEGVESITSHDLGDGGLHSSLELDASGYPVISYYGRTSESLKLLHCDDSNCAGGGESITVADSAGVVGFYSSLELDGAGNPLVSYYDATNGNLKLLHCDDPNCAGGGESITSPDTVGDVGRYTSLKLDANGYPVVSYGGSDPKVLHCDDPNCDGTGESYAMPDPTGRTSRSSALVLDASGNPVVSYSGPTPSSRLRLLHCGDPNCASAQKPATPPATPTPTATQVPNNNSITTPDTGFLTGWFASLELDASGNPVVSYVFDWLGDQDLSILHCDDPACDGVGESITLPDTSTAGSWTSLELDASGNPVVAYHSVSSGLKVLHCDDPACDGVGDSVTSPLTGSTGESPNSLVLDAAGLPVISYRDQSNMELRLLYCDDPNCAGGGESISVLASGDVNDGSLALDANGYPVVSYYDYGNGDLKLLHCDDPVCDGVGESLTSPDTLGDVGEGPSLVLDGSGNPVVSYYDVTNHALKVLHCDDPNCDGAGDSVTTPDNSKYSSGDITSLALDASGNPVVAYTDGFPEGILKVLHCDDPNCSGGGESIVVPDKTAHADMPSMALDAAGNPVVAYIDLFFVPGLKVLHCADPNCVGVKSAPPPVGGHVVSDGLTGAATSALDAGPDGGRAIGVLWLALVAGALTVALSAAGRHLIQRSRRARRPG